MDKLILLVGPSGSGKTTIAKELEKEGYNIIHSYTTRKPREPNEWGHTFVDRNELAQAPFNIIAIGKRPELYNIRTVFIITKGSAKGIYRLVGTKNARFILITGRRIRKCGVLYRR